MLKTVDRKKTSLTTQLGFGFLIFGSLLLAISYYLTSQILAFSGLGLTFWGALFLIITPTNYVEENLVTSISYSTYQTTDRILRYFNYKGNGLYIPSYPSEVYIPDHLKGLKEMVVFIPESEEVNIPPSIEELAKGKFISENPKGILLTPPGLQLFTAIEEKSRLNLPKTNITDLCELLPGNILDNYNLAKEITMKIKEDIISIQITNSVFRDFYTEFSNVKSIYLLGCPLVSSIVCAIAKSSGKPTIIQSIKSSPDTPVIQVQLKILQGE